MTAYEAFEQSALLLEGSAALHFAYSDPSRNRFREPQEQEKWKWSGEFLAEAARKVRKMQQAISCPENGQ